MNFINDPFNTLLEVMKENYPNAECDIYIGESMADGIETFGCTLFPEESTDPRAIIEIHHSLSLTDATEILAHELAHVVAGADAEHNEEWEKVFSNIHLKFQEKIEKKIGYAVEESE